MKPANPAIVLVHGGATASMEDVDGCEAAAKGGFKALRTGGDALAAVIAAVTILEDDGRFNAGAGAELGSDGQTIEMDASVMDSQGKLGAVACIQRIRHPVRAASEVAESPHRLLCGEGAERFARVRGLEAPLPPSAEVLRRRQAAVEEMQRDTSDEAAKKRRNVEQSWNYPTSGAYLAGTGCDTVGAVARDEAGRFAVAASTGRVAPSLLGRVGDTPLIGAGFYAGPDGAVAITGTGEQIIPLLPAHTVFRWLADGVPLQQALQRGLSLLPAGADIGLIAVTHTESGHASNGPMPTATVSTHDQ